jgi:mannose-1-phosphate guanylyltransferase / mannose-6-phosphate isomerase
LIMAIPQIIPLILSGGAGTRLWPLSRDSKPKQFLRFSTEYSLFQETLLRCKGPIFDDRAIVVSGENQRFLIAEDLNSIGAKAEIILEPMRRDSCAAIAVGCLQAIKRAPDALVLVLAADHLIPDAQAFVQAVAAASIDATNGYLTTFGIKPTHAATGYGYIHPGALIRNEGCSRIDAFVEKPNVETAQKYIREGYLWNSGNFLFSAAAFIAELKIHAPKIFEAATKSLELARHETDFIWLNTEAFSESPQISVDYAVMEKTEKTAVMAVDYDWRDIGSWDAVYALFPADDHANVIEGQGLVLNGRNNLVHSAQKITTLSGVDDLIVVVTDDAVMITKRGQSEKIKELVGALVSHSFKNVQ